MNEEKNSQKSFNFLEYIRNPQASDEKQIEINDYVSNINKSSQKVQEFQTNFGKDLHEEEKHNDFSNNTFAEKTNEKTIDLSKQSFTFFEEGKTPEKIEKPAYEMYESKEIPLIDYFVSKNEQKPEKPHKIGSDIKENEEIFGFSPKEFSENKQNVENFKDNTKIFDVSEYPFLKEFQKSPEPLLDIEEDLPFTFEKEPPKKGNAENFLEMEEENHENIVFSSEEQKENQQKNDNLPEPSIVYGHTLEDFIYNVNNLRGHLNRLKRVTENTGIDTRIIENLDDSFNMAITGIQQKIQDAQRNFQGNNEENEVLPELSEEILNQWLSANHILNNMRDNLENELKRQHEYENNNIDNSNKRSVIQVFRKIKNFAIIVTLKLKNFGGKIYITMKNPQNILTLFILLMSLLFFSGLKQMPDFEKYGEFFDWLAYNKNSKMLLFSSTIILVSAVAISFKALWTAFIGKISNEDKNKIAYYLLDFSSIIHLGIMYMADSDLIQNKFDLSIWLCLATFYTIINGFLQMAANLLKLVISNTQFNTIESDHIKIRNIYKMVSSLFIFSLLCTMLGLYLFYYSGFYLLSLLLFDMFLLIIESLKTILIIQNLNGNLQFYTDNNCDQIKDPFFFTETLFDTIYYLSKILHYLQLTFTYLKKSCYTAFFHFWILYMFREIQSSISKIKKNYDNLLTFQNVINNLNSEFPLVEDSELSNEEMCSICHENLLIGRKLKCNHKFHIKCLFYWLKAQQKTTCPVCRAEIQNITFLKYQKRSLLYRIISIIANLTDLNIRFVSGRPQQDNIAGENDNMNLNNPPF